MAETLSSEHSGLAQRIIKRARKRLEKGGHVDAMAMVINSKKPDSKIAIVVVNNENRQNKEDSAEKIRVEAIRNDADLIIFVTEAWTLGIPTDSEKDAEDFKNWGLDTYGSIGNSPFREDKFFITLEFESGVWAGMSEIKSLKNGRTFGEIVLEKVSMCGGTYSKFLSPIKNK
jgi:hypothetical protein